MSMPETAATALPDRPIRIGSRASPLAMAQARMAATALMARHRLAADQLVLVPITATGDRITDRPLADIGGKALWTRELDRALADGDIDMAVHSLKDVENPRPAQFALSAILPRADVRDRLVVRPGLAATTIADLPPACRLGTCSPRRRAQVLALRPDIQIVMLRGNIATRLARLNADDLDATLLAAAGLDRLGLMEVGTPQPVAALLPAASQGAVGIECRADAADLCAMVAAIDCTRSRAAVMAERCFLTSLGGTCHSPVAATATYGSEDVLELAAAIYAGDGSIRVDGCAPVRQLADAARLASEMLDRAPREVRDMFTS